MKNVIIIGTIGLLAAIVIGIQVGIDYPLLLLSSGDRLHQIIRVGLIGLLLVLLFSAPPRSIYFRTFLGVFAILLSTGSFVMMESYRMALFDAVLFIQVAIIFGIEALEAPIHSRSPTVHTSK